MNSQGHHRESQRDTVQGHAAHRAEEAGLRAPRGYVIDVIDNRREGQNNQRCQGDEEQDGARDDEAAARTCE